MHLHSPADFGVGTVIASTRCTSGPRGKSASFVRHVSIDISKTKIAKNFRAGQSFGVLPPGLDHNNQPHKLRLYSIASPTRGEDGSANVLATTVKRTIDEHWDSHKLFLGVASNYLCDLQVGDEVKVTGPSGKRFLVPTAHDQHDYVFFATGTGIAPFRGMLMDLLSSPDAAPSKSNIILVMGSPYSSDLLYHDELTALASKHKNFTYLTAISRERQDDGGPAIYAHDRLATHRDLFASVLSSSRGLLYICGISGMEMGVFQNLHTILPTDARDQYLAVDPEAATNTKSWDRKMLHKQLRPTRRVFLEVY